MRWWLFALLAVGACKTYRTIDQEFEIVSDTDLPPDTGDTDE